MASLLPESAKTALGDMQIDVLYFFGIVVIFGILGSIITTLIKTESYAMRRIIYGLIVGVGFFVALKVVF